MDIDSLPLTGPIFRAYFTKKSRKIDNRETGTYLNTTCIKDFNDENIVCAFINNEYCEILIDTGSTVSTVLDTLVKQIGTETKELTVADFTICTLANGAKAPFLGTVSIAMGLEKVFSAISF